MTIMKAPFGNGELLWALEENLFLTFKSFCVTTTGEIKDEPGSLTLITGVPHPLLNAVMRVDMGTVEEARAHVRQKIGHFSNLKLPMIWWTGPRTVPCHIGPLLMEEGLVFEGDSPAMAMSLECVEGDMQEGPLIKQVSDDKLMTSFSRLMVSVFELPPWLMEPFFLLYKRLGYDREGVMEHFIAYGGEEPAGIVSVSFAAGVAGIWNMAVLPGKRKSGFGRALARRALSQARERGYEAAVLISTQAGLNLYRHIGFREVCTIGQYIFEPGQKKMGDSVI